MAVLLLLALALSSNVQAQEWTSEGGVLKYNGERYYLKAVSWFGFETSLYVFHGLWSVDYYDMFKGVAERKFNGMRIPFSLDAVLEDPIPVSISYGYCQSNMSCNLDLKGLTSLQVLEKMIDVAASYGIVIMLDMHSFEPDAYAANGLWYDASHSESLVLSGWDILIDRFAGKKNVIAVDLKNEPFSTTWAVGNNDTDWDAAATRIGNHILAKAPWLIVVEGTAGSPPCAQNCFFGENLEGVKANPITLSVPKKLVYSPHTYGPDVYPQPYFSDPTFPANMPAIWDAHFGYIRDMNTTAVVTGEWGGHTSGADGVWLQAYIDYMISKDMTDQFFWCLNPDSGDTGGLLADDWVTWEQDKLDMLAKLVPNPTVIKF